MELLEIPLVGDTKESQLPTPEEYTFHIQENNRPLLNLAKECAFLNFYIK